MRDGVDGDVLVMGEPREECVVCRGRRTQVWVPAHWVGRRNLAPSLMIQRKTPSSEGPGDGVAEKRS